MSEQSHPLSDPRVFASTGLDRLGATPLRGTDPQQVGPFRIVALLGSGGMGRIYLGRDRNGGPGLAAVKVIRPEYAEDAQFRRRFEREAEALARVQGGQTAVLLGRGFDQELLWMATEYIPGLSLSATVADHGTLDLAAAWRLAADLGRAVGAMERADVVHRDIKPSNVILGPDGCRLIDFGISQAGDTSSITVTGQQVGTPAYMSPEQVRGTAVATSSDIFALGSVLAYALTGNAPFGDGTSVDVLHRVAFDPPREDVLERVAVADRELAQLVRACLAKEPQQRPTPEAVVATAATRQAAAPWSAALHESIMTRIQVAAAVSELPLDSAPVQETLILSRRDPAEDAGGLAVAAVAAVAAEAAPGPSPFASPFAHPHQPQQPQQPQQQSQTQPPQQRPQAQPQAQLQPQPQQPTPPTVATVTSTPVAPYVLRRPAATAPSSASFAPEPEERSRRRTGLLVAAAVLAVAAVAGTTVLLARPSGHQSAAGIGGTTGVPGQVGSVPASGPASASASGTASASATGSAPASATPSAHASGTPSGGAGSSSRPSTPGGAGGSGRTTSPAAPTSPAGGGGSNPAPTTTRPAPPATTAPAVPPVPAWIKNCTYYSGSAETDPGSKDTSAVKEIQCILTYRGYNVVDGIDGQFGPNTENAVKAFQKAKGLGVDGEVGPQTWPALRSSS